MILCFWIIAFHDTGDKNKSKYKILNAFFHVAAFILISFYLINPISIADFYYLPTYLLPKFCKILKKYINQIFFLNVLFLMQWV
jgi:hypothetical protein